MVALVLTKMTKGGFSMAKEWKIGEFAAEIGKHSNTVANWFNQLHELKMHWVNRNSIGEKVYDELDLKIAFHIKELREKKVAINEIFEDISNHCQLRYFSVDDSLEEAIGPLSDIEQIKVELLYMVHDVLSETLWDEFEAFRSKLEKLVNSLPNLHEGRHDRIKDFLIIRKVEAALEKEALQKWSTKPDFMRLKRVILFRKGEDIEARNQFVKDYVNRHLEERLLNKTAVDF